ncbi:hypothetical protein [Parasitella parasitica]|uniref:Uncharacterized protein n=1 Tax=Parasitella parasitica TaxID=35722 RepID=A0A0B7NH69_9FUNG|nr:hypothetical protein [Parasitella parasitica]
MEFYNEHQDKFQNIEKVDNLLTYIRRICQNEGSVDANSLALDNFWRPYLGYIGYKMSLNCRLYVVDSSSQDSRVQVDHQHAFKAEQEIVTFFGDHRDRRASKSQKTMNNIFGVDARLELRISTEGRCLSQACSKLRIPFGARPHLVSWVFEELLRDINDDKDFLINEANLPECLTVIASAARSELLKSHFAAYNINNGVPDQVANAYALFFIDLNRLGLAKTKHIALLKATKLEKFVQNFQGSNKMMAIFLDRSPQTIDVSGRGLFNTSSFGLILMEF